ncbi:MAG: hypothetical protein EHM90_04575 [Chloroflexi bacterium]|nr:MAG: hypothetical protein EHM90_04575 [Chloroflexota bacterium]
MRAVLEVSEVGRLLEAGGPDGWLGVSISGGPSDMRRYATDLHIGQPAARSRLAIRKSAFVDVGSIKRGEENLRVEISWRSASLAPLFPVFSGWLTVRSEEIAINGCYIPPGGRLGHVADRALMHRAAEYTAEWLLGELARAAAAPPTTLHQAPTLTNE